MAKSIQQLTFTLLLLFLGLLAQAQSAEKNYDNIAATYFSADQPGGVVLIAKNGKPVYKKAFGMANMELNVPMKTDMVFEIGSLTKQFTAVAILQLMEQGRLSVNDPISKYLPDFPTGGHPLTLHHLLTHTAGIQNYTNMQEWYNIWRQDLSLQETIALFDTKPLEFVPGDRFSYSNSGYLLLGSIIEKVSGMRYADYLQKNILQPAGMTHTQFGSHQTIIKNRASGYQKNSALVNAEYLSFTQPHASGALMSTVDDFLAWHKALQSGRVIRSASLRLAQTNYKNNSGAPINYGYGWMFNELYGSRTIEHGGGIFGFASYCLYLPEEDVFVVVMTNCDSFNPESLSVKLAAAAVNKQTVVAAKTPLDPKVAAKYVGSYIFDDRMTRHILLEQDTLYSQLPGGQKMALLPLSDQEFVFEGIVDASLKFDVNGNTVTATLKNRNQSKKGTKTDVVPQIPDEKALPASILKSYAGKYKLGPNILFTVEAGEKRLFLQFPGQDKIEAYATAEDHFYAAVADVKLQFTKGDQARPGSVLIIQNGQTVSAQKIE